MAKKSPTELCVLSQNGGQNVLCVANLLNYKQIS